MFSNFLIIPELQLTLKKKNSDKEKNDLLVRTSLFNQKVQGSIYFLVF
jgi:hypothetical protein